MEKRQRDWSNTIISQGMEGSLATLRLWEAKRVNYLLEFLEEHYSDDNFIIDF
jgi:hypothetical protein